MKKLNIQRVLFWVIGIVSMAAVFGGATGLQMLPLVAFLVMTWLDMKKHTNLAIVISVLAFIMVLVNVFTLGYIVWVDSLLWLAVGLAWL